MAKKRLSVGNVSNPLDESTFFPSPTTTKKTSNVAAKQSTETQTKSKQSKKDRVIRASFNLPETMHQDIYRLKGRREMQYGRRVGLSEIATEAFSLLLKSEQVS